MGILNKERWGLSDLCLTLYFLMGLTFLRARLGSFAIYTVFPLWFALSWLRRWNRMMSNPAIRNVIFAYPLFIAAMFLIHYLNGIPVERGIFLSKLYTYAFIGWLVFAYYHELKLADKMRFFLFLGLGVAVVNAGWNFVVEGQYAFASRAMTGGSLERQIETGAIDYDLVEALELGVASFGRVCSFGFLVPVLWYTARYAVKKYKTHCYAALGVFLIVILRAAYLLVVVYVGVGLYTAFLAGQTKVSVKQLWVLSLVILAILFSLFLLLASPILDTLENVDPIRNNEVYVGKIREIKEVIQTGNLSEMSRISNYQASYEVARDNLLTGIGYDGRFALGGHSQVLDMIGMTGILGFLPYLIFFFIANRYYVVAVERRWLYVKNLRSVLWIPLIFACFTNPMNSYDVWMLYFFYTPAMSYIFKEMYRPPFDRSNVLLPRHPV